MLLKRIFSLLVILFLTTSLSMADTLVSSTSAIPQWSEFCPEEYINAQYKDINDVDFKSLSAMPYNRSNKKWVKIVRNATILPVLDYWLATQMRKSSIKKQYDEFNQNLAYWQNRKKVFDAEMATANSAPKAQQALCYMQVRQMELQKNQAEIQNQLLIRQITSQNINAMNQNMNMQNMNRSLNNNWNRYYP